MIGAMLGGQSAVELALLFAVKPFLHDAVRIVEPPIADGVGERGLTDVIVPLVGGSWPVTIVERLPYRSSRPTAREFLVATIPA